MPPGGSAGFRDLCAAEYWLALGSHSLALREAIRPLAGVSGEALKHEINFPAGQSDSAAVKKEVELKRYLSVTRAGPK